MRPGTRNKLIRMLYCPRKPRFFCRENMQALNTLAEMLMSLFRCGKR